MPFARRQLSVGWDLIEVDLQTHLAIQSIAYTNRFPKYHFRNQKETVMSFNTMSTKTDPKNAAHPEKDVTPVTPVETEKSAQPETADDGGAQPKAPVTEPKTA